MKPGTQFKIESIEELKEIYDHNPEKWYWPLKMEITDFEMGMNYAVNHNGKYLLLNKSDEYETIPNPFKKYSWQRVKKTLDGLGCHNLEEEESGEDKESLILEELNSLRKEVEELKQREIDKEKPKESADLKIKHPSCELTLMDNDLYDSITIRLKNDVEGFNFLANKDEAIKIVNYLKKHFEI